MPGTSCAGLVWYPSRTTVAATTILFIVWSSSVDNTDAPRHERGTEQDQHDRDHFEVNDQAQPPHAFVADGWRLALRKALPPASKLKRRKDREQSSNHEQRELGDERPAMEVVRRALLVVKDARQPHDQQNAG